MQLKRYLPSRDQIRETRSLRFLGAVILESNLWHFNRHSLSYAVLIGCICCFLPIPFQMVPCALLCILLRCNIPVAILIVWISNPITYGPMMYFAYTVGLRLLGMATPTIPELLTFDWFLEQLADVWLPLLVGCLICGLITGAIGFLSVRLYYRWRINRYIQQRRQRQR